MRHFLSALLLFLLLAAAAGATEITVLSSYPAIYELEPPADPALEGTVTVTAYADGTLEPLESPAWLEEIAADTWATTYAWADTTARQARFVDTALDTHTVVFQRAAVMPYDPARHIGPVLLIETEPANLWDAETGLYVWGLHDNFEQRGSEWERPATVTYLDAAGAEVFSEPIGLRINGQSSREYDQKGLRLYFDDYGDSDTITHDFFGDGPVTCERLVLRSSRYTIFPISSGLNEPLHRELGHPGSRLGFVSVYLNGEYWGVYSLRERLDKKWVETTHEWADDGYVLIKDNEAEAGDFGAWQEVLDGCQPPGDFASHAWFQWLESNLDPIAYIDWLLLNLCGETADNMHGKNMALLQIGGAPFDFVAWDEDLLYQSQNRLADHLSFYASGDAAEFAATQPPLWYSGGPWSFTFEWNNLLRAAMQNAEFKALLRARANELLDGPLGPEAMNDRLDILAADLQDEWANHRLRWGHGLSFSYYVSSVRSQLTLRGAQVPGLVAGFLETWAQPVELSSFAATIEGPDVLLNWHTEREEDCAGFILERSEDAGATFQPIAGHDTEPALVATGGLQLPADYVFTDSGAPLDLPLAYRLSWVDGGGQSHVLPWVEELFPDAVFNLRLNEFMASNDTTVSDGFGEFDDWLELFNAGPDTVSLAGLFLSDNLGSPTKWELPAMNLAPGAFLLVWCDEDMEQGPLHAAFKLSAGGEELGLFARHDLDYAPIDTIVFGDQEDDVSWGRSSDGDGDWLAFDHPTPGVSNTAVSSAGTAQNLMLGLEAAWPNPSTGAVQIMGRLPHGVTDARLRIYDVRGALVRELMTDESAEAARVWTWDGNDGTGRRVSTGMYLLRLESARGISQGRVLMIR